MGDSVIWVIGFLLISSICVSQGMKFDVSVSADTLYIGNDLGIKYTIENMQGDFQRPDFEGFGIVGGPNVSNQFSMINGKVSQSASYEYFLRPESTGLYLIPSAALKQENREYFAPEIFILVMDNPEQIRQDPRDYSKHKEAYGGLNSAQLSPEDSLKIKLRKIKAKRI